MIVSGIVIETIKSERISYRKKKRMAAVRTIPIATFFHASAFMASMNVASSDTQMSFMPAGSSRLSRSIAFFTALATATGLASAFFTTLMAIQGLLSRVAR